MQFFGSRRVVKRKSGRVVRETSVTAAGTGRPARVPLSSPFKKKLAGDLPPPGPPQPRGGGRALGGQAAAPEKRWSRSESRAHMSPAPAPECLLGRHRPDRALEDHGPWSPGRLGDVLSPRPPGACGERGRTSP